MRQLYLDCDGVLADFDKGATAVLGLPPRAFEQRHGLGKFWQKLAAAPDFYFGLPLAMIVLCLTVVPFFHRAKVYTAYEVLERRFDPKTRSLTSLLFLVSRCLACGVVISAPAVILSIVLGWSLTVTG